MTVENQTLSVTYAGNGSQTNFPITFEFIIPSQIRVSQIVGDTTTLLTPGVHYSVSGSTVTMFTAPANGTTLKIQRVTSIVQSADLRQQGQYHPETLERMADLLTMICQELRAGIVDAVEIIGAGEANSGENVNDEGVGVYEGKVGTVLQFRGVAAGSSKISVVHDTATETIKVDLGTVSPSDVGAAPASLSGTVSSLSDTVSSHTASISDHEDRITDLEGRRPVSARGFYVFDGVSQYDLQSEAYDPDGILPEKIDSNGDGTINVYFSTPLPHQKYRVSIFPSFSAENPARPARACFDLPLSEGTFTAFFCRGQEDVGVDVQAFSMFVDYEVAP